MILLRLTGRGTSGFICNRKIYWNKCKYKYGVWAENKINCHHYLLIQYMILLRLTDRGTSGWICNRKIYWNKYKYRYSVWGQNQVNYYHYLLI